eukprot:gene23414-biopygen17814
MRRRRRRENEFVTPESGIFSMDLPGNVGSWERLARGVHEELRDAAHRRAARGARRDGGVPGVPFGGDRPLARRRAGDAVRCGPARHARPHAGAVHLRLPAHVEPPRRAVVRGERDEQRAPHGTREGHGAARADRKHGLRAPPAGGVGPRREVQWEGDSTGTWRSAEKWRGEFLQPVPAASRWRCCARPGARQSNCAVAAVGSPASPYPSPSSRTLASVGGLCRSLSDFVTGPGFANRAQQNVTPQSRDSLWKCAVVAKGMRPATMEVLARHPNCFQVSQGHAQTWR